MESDYQLDPKTYFNFQIKTFHFVSSKYGILIEFHWCRTNPLNI